MIWTELTGQVNVVPTNTSYYKYNNIFFKDNNFKNVFTYLKYQKQNVWELVSNIFLVRYPTVTVDKDWLNSLNAHLKLWYLLLFWLNWLDLTEIYWICMLASISCTVYKLYQIIGKKYLAHENNLLMVVYFLTLFLIGATINTFQIKRNKISDVPFGNWHFCTKTSIFFADNSGLSHLKRFNNLTLARTTGNCSWVYYTLSGTVGVPGLKMMAWKWH